MTTDFIDEVRTRSARFAKRLEHLSTEEATKNALVMPFIQMLGYDVFDPSQVVPEFTADVGVKRHEKVDYALMSEGRPVMLVECKRYGATLKAEFATQLLRYFNVTEAKFAILTDGIEYRFFSELDDPNVMDARPFFVFNMLDVTEEQVQHLKGFTRQAFNEGDAFEAARDLKYTREIKQTMADEFAKPSEEFVRFLIRRIQPNTRFTSANGKLIRSLVHPALTQFMHERISERLKTALEREDEPTPELPAVEKPSGEPTQEELQALEVVRSIVSDVIEPEKLTLHWYSRYCTVLMHVKNQGRVVCILRIRTTKKRIQLGHYEPRLPVESVEGIRDHADAIRVHLADLMEGDDEQVD